MVTGESYVVVLVRELGRYPTREEANAAAVDDGGSIDDLMIVRLPPDEKPKRRKR